jgi:hypothetical protein
MFADAELVNNKLELIRILPTSVTPLVFTSMVLERNKKLYIIMEGTEYLEKNDLKAKKKIYIRKKYYYNRGSGFHGLKILGFA